MKKIVAILLAAMMIFALVGCAGTGVKDSEYVKNKGKLLVGITDYAPMDYKDENGNWVGFDADLARAFAESLGVKVEFVEINWDKKILELDSKAIDCVWNGMTLTDEVKAAMSTSNTYLTNTPVIVVPADKAEGRTTLEDYKGMTFAVENGSSGKAAAEDNGLNFIEVDTQVKALMEVAAGTSDGAIIDALMADAMLGEGKGYSQLVSTLKFESEEFGVGFRKGSDLTAMLNDFLKNNEALIQELTAKYITK